MKKISMTVFSVLCTGLFLFAGGSQESAGKNLIMVGGRRDSTNTSLFESVSPTSPQSAGITALSGVSGVGKLFLYALKTKPRTQKRS